MIDEIISSQALLDFLALLSSNSSLNMDDIDISQQLIKKIVISGSNVQVSG